MKFETRFDIGDYVWCMKSNMPVEVILSSIDIFFVNTNQDHIKYNAKNAVGSVSWLDHQNLLESMLFKSKIDLLNSLFSIKTTCKGANCGAAGGVNHSAECVLEHDKIIGMEREAT